MAYKIAFLLLLAQLRITDPFPRIRTVAAQDLTRLPDFTCSMAIERGQRRSPNARFERTDSIRLEVAFADQQELYAWPGSDFAGGQHIDQFVGRRGAISTGDFASHARGLFLFPQPDMKYAGLETAEGRSLHHLHFRVPRDRSRWLVGDYVTSLPAGYEGDAWADASSFHLVRIALRVTDMPPGVQFSRAETVIDYQVVRLGDEDRLLPRSSLLLLAEPSGLENLNRTTFSNCRQYSSQSELRFEDTPAGDSPAAPTPPISIPPGLDLHLKLETPVLLKTASAGDILSFQLQNEAKHKGQTVLPKGANIFGRILAVELVRGQMTALRFTLRLERVESGGSTGRLRAEMVHPAPGFIVGLPPSRQPRQSYRPPDNSTGIIFVLIGQSGLASGFPMSWRTLESSGGVKP